MVKRVRNQRGVTLVELMVVVAIIAVIAAIAITVYQNIQQRARLSADQAVVSAMRSAISIYYGQHNGVFPGSPGAYVNPTPPAFRCVGLTYSYTTTSGNLQITSANDVTDCP